MAKKSSQSNNQRVAPDNLVMTSFFFSSQGIVANPSHNPADTFNQTCEFDGSCAERETENQYVIAMTCTCKDSFDDSNVPYNYNVEVIGFFEYEGLESDRDHVLKSVGAIGCQVLAGPIRERIASLTSRGPWDATSFGVVNVSAILSNLSLLTNDGREVSYQGEKQ